MAHFYDNDGVLHAYVPYADPAKGMREATLADARKNGWLPSVTTVLNDLNKPQLGDWRVMEALKVALPMGATTVTPEVLTAVKRESEAYRDWSAEFGTQVHHMVSLGLRGLEYAVADYLLGAQDVADGFLEWAGPNGLQVTESELSFSSSLGYGGTIDGIGTWYGEPCIFDLKTQDFGGPNDKKSKPDFYDPEWPLQMAGYDIGCRDFYMDPNAIDHIFRRDMRDIPLTRISFVLSRTKPGLVVPHQWPDPERYDAGWLARWEAWQCDHRWGKWAKGVRLEVLQGGLSLED